MYCNVIVVTPWQTGPQFNASMLDSLLYTVVVPAQLQLFSHQPNLQTPTTTTFNSHRLLRRWGVIADCRCIRLPCSEGHPSGEQRRRSTHDVHLRLVLHLWLGRWWAWLLLNGPPLGSRNGCRPLPGTSHSHPRSEDGCATIMYFWVKRKTWIPHLIKKVNISKCERVSVKCVPSVLCKHNLVCTKNFS